MKSMKNILILLLTVFSFALNAQNNSLDEKAFQSLRGHGSMNAVIIVAGIILTGIFITLFRLERKVGAIEKELNKK
ncbi:MAG: hypothetical protein Fur0041_09110 [Bacteroidia bacterium]